MNFYDFLYVSYLLLNYKLIFMMFMLGHTQAINKQGLRQQLFNVGLSENEVEYIFLSLK